MIGLATTFFWIFLFAFLSTAVYSVKDVQFNFGDPQTTTNTNNEIIFSLPVTIGNRGYYDIGSFKIVTEIYDNDGLPITSGSTFVPVIRKNEDVTVTHNMTISASELLQRSQDYLFNDSEILIYTAVGMSVAEVIPVQASTNFSTHWGAPLYNFALGEPEYTPYNVTHFRVTVPISFENHAFFDLLGSVQVKMYSSSNAPVGEGQTSIEAYANSPYNGNVELAEKALGRIRNEPRHHRRFR